MGDYTIKTINKSIEINAPKGIVWQTLLDFESYKAWTAAFTEDSIIETDWEVGSKAVFKDGSETGMVGHISEHIPEEVITIEYDGVIREGKEIVDESDEEAKAFKGSEETYTVKENEGVTTLEIKSDMIEKYIDMLSDAWDKALENIKMIAEAIQDLIIEGYQDIFFVPISTEESEEHTHDEETAHIIIKGNLVITDSEGTKTYIVGDRVTFPSGATHKAKSTLKDSVMIVGLK